MEFAIGLVVSVAIIMIGILSLQKNHYQFLKGQQDRIDLSKISQELELRLKEFDEYKKRVDGLTIKAGFKL